MGPSRFNFEEATMGRDSPFVQLFSREGRTKMLDVFLQKPYSDLTVSQVSDQANISRSTFHRNIDSLVEIGLVREVRTPKQGKTYRLNNDSDLTKLLGKIRIELVKHSRELDRGELRDLPEPDKKDLKYDDTDESSEDVNGSSYAPDNASVMS